MGPILRRLILIGVSICAAARAAAAPVITVSIADNAVLGDVVSVRAQVTSEAGIAKVEFSVDDQIRMTQAKPPFEYKWDTIDEMEGRHTVIVNAYDGAGQASTKRIKVEVDNDLTKGVKPHAEKAMARFRAEDFDGAMLEARKAYRIDNASLDAIRALAAATGGKGDINRALNLLEEPQRINNQVVGDPKSFPLADRASLELRALFRTKRAAKQTTPAALLADMATVYDFWRKLADMQLAEIRAARGAGATTPASLILEGDALFNLGDVQAALTSYGKVPKSGREGVIAQNRQAAALLSTRRLREAEQILSAMVTVGSASDQTHALLAALYLRQYRFERARAEADGPAKRGSLTGKLVSAYAELAFLNFSRAFDLLKQVDAKGPTAESRYLAACYFLDVRDMARATETLFDSLRLAPGNLDIYVLRALQLAILVPKDGVNQALPLLDYVLQKDPINAGAMAGKAALLYQLKRPKPAEPLVRELMREDRYAADVWIVSAVMYAAGTEQVKATESLAEARKLSPDRFPDTLVPVMPEFLPRMARYRRPPLITPAILDAEDPIRQP
jgi:predicted Zn-dependent protease